MDTSGKTVGRLYLDSLQGEGVLPALAAARDWVRKGTHRTQWAVTPSFFVFLSTFICGGHSYRATYWGAVLVAAFWVVEGHRTPDEAMGC